MRSIASIVLTAFTLLVFTPPRASAGENESGYYILAGVCAVGALGCFAIYDNVKECEKDYDPLDASEEALECQRRDIIKWSALGVGVVLTGAAIYFLLEGLEASTRKSNALINYSSDGELSFHFPEINYNVVTGASNITVLKMSF